jgi:hypothetical protein
MLPCKPDEFRDFIAGLLGRPQTINRMIPGVFEIGRDDIISLYHLINQRINQQNEASLIQFTAKIAFDDNSSVELTSLSDVSSYNEVRPIRSTAVHLSWAYLVRFHDRAAPERQQIDISFTTGHSIYYLDESSFMPRFRHQGLVHLRVSHTARTWGADIDSLLENYIKTLLKVEPKLTTVLRQHSGKFGLSLGVVVLLGLLIGGIFAIDRFRQSRLESAKEAQTLSTNEQTSYIIDTMASGEWASFLFYLGIYLFASLVVSIICAIWASEAAETTPPSFVILSKKAEEKKQEILKQNRRKLISFATSIVVGVSTSIAGSCIFAAITE